jgi:hypothetical protein
LGDGFDEFEAVHAGHAVVGEQQIDRGVGGFEDAQGFGAAFGHQDVEVRRPPGSCG